MKKITILCLMLSFVACQTKQNHTDVLGKWKVNSKFYQATCQILEEDNSLNGLVLYYFDGTSKFSYNGTVKRYLFTDLKKKEGVYVDGISGATSKNAAPESVHIRLKSADTLEVTSYIMNKPLVEIWTKIKDK